MDSMNMKTILIDFHYEGNIMSLKCLKEEIMQDIHIKFCNKALINLNSVFFLYNGNRTNDNLSLREIINNEDKKRNKMDILVYLINETTIIQNKSYAKSKQVICPKCGENAKIKIKDYLITIHGCKNNHITENILFEQFENTQLIKEVNIKCDSCKKINNAKSFYFCCSCKNKLCESCKYYHNQNHMIINYESKNYICLEHGDNYNSYCQNCKKNICIACEVNHLNHNLITFGKLLPKKENLNNKINELKINIDKFKEEINKLKNILNYVSDKIDCYYNIVNDIYNSFELKKRNYEILSNINEINNNDIVDDFNEIINEYNIPNKFCKINIIYNKMKNNNQIISANNINMLFLYNNYQNYLK